MKKVLTLIAAAAAILFVASCGNRQTSGSNETEETVKSELELQAEALIKIHLDSLASEITKVNPIGIVGAVKEGKVVLSDKEKQVKPDYLADPKNANKLQTLSQKYRAIALYCVDKEIAKLYDMNLNPYNVALTKLYADVNDAALKSFAEGLEIKESIQSFYNAEKEAGRDHLFWEAVTAAIVEQMYIAAQNTEKFIVAFDDESASDFTWYITLLTAAVDDLASINKEYVYLNAALAPLTKLNAINVAQFEQQLNSIKEEITASRENLIK